MALPAMAQESEHPWWIGGDNTIYPTQRDAELAIPLFGGPYEYVKYIRNVSIAKDEIKLTYWMGQEASVVRDWKYVDLVGAFDTEAELIAALVAQANNSSAADGCTVGTTVAQSSWSSLADWDDGVPRRQMQQVTLKYRADSALGGHCSLITSNQFPTRQRERCSNEYLSWQSASNTCSNNSYEVTLLSDPLECAICSLVGNPIDVTTGDKFQQESDIALGWFTLQRSYHSAAANVSGGFGHGWTHNHDSKLSFDGSTPSGMLKPDGSHVAFESVGAAYEAVDGSGDRLVQNGSDWWLHQADRIQVFNAAGRLAEVRYPDGSTLAYAYDAISRLTSIAHSSGRVVTFQYENAGGEAPIVALTSSGQVLAAYTYNAQGQVESAIYPGGAARIYHYEDSRFPRHLTGVTREDGQRYATFAYDASGRAVSSQHTGGVDSVGLVYSPTGGATVTGALGGTTAYALTTPAGSGVPRKVAGLSDSRGQIDRTYYPESTDFRRRLDTVTDRNGTVAKHQYAEITDTVSGLLVSAHTVTEAQGTAQARTIEQRTELATNRLLMTLAGNRGTRITRNARQQATAVTVRDTTTNATRTTAYAYCEAADVAASNSTCPLLGLLKSVDGPRTDLNDVTAYAYYPSDDASCASAPATCPHRKGDLWKTTNALGQVTEILQYDAQGRVLSLQDINGVVTDYEYHPRGWLTATKVRGPNAGSETDDRITSVIYESTGLVQRTTEPDGSYLGFTYDVAQRLTDVTDNAGNTIHYTLDAAGNRTKEDTKDSGNTLRRTLSRVYNVLGQQTQHKDAGNHITATTFDVDGNPSLVTDPLSRVVDHDYDPLNRIARTVQDPGGIAAETVYQYDALDQVTQVTDPKGLNTGYTYNGFGDVTQLTSPDTGVTQYGYDSAGNLGSRQDANDAQAHTYAYDALNRLTSVSMLATSGGNDIVYQYDGFNTGCGGEPSLAQGHMTRTTKTFGATMMYCYGRFGQVETKMQIVGGRFFVVNYTYTAAGDVKSINYPDGAVVDYVRNAQGRIIEVGVTPNGGSRTMLLNQTGYAPFGPAVGWVYGNGRTLARQHDLDYRPSTIQDNASGGLSLHYGYDAAGQLTELKDGLQSAFLARYDYDNLGRLTILRDGTSSVPIETYTYDAIGNRTSLLHGSYTKPFTYASNSHRLSSVDGVVRDYDGVGNTTAIGGTTKQFNYGEDDRLRSVLQGGTFVRHYSYNALGERVLSIVPGVTGNPDGSGGIPDVHTYTVYDESGRWLGDYDTTGKALQQAIWLDGLPVGLLAGAGANQKLHYIEPDHLGTPRAVIDRTRDVAIWTWALQGEAFGNSPPNQDPDLDSTAFVLDMRFPGQRYDMASGLNYNYFRDYDAASGRYVQSDPIGLRGGITTYGYAGADPLTYSDPLGLAKMNLFPPNTGAWRLFEKIPDSDDECLVGGHGTPFYVAKQSPAQLADRISNDAACRDKRIILYACNTGVRPEEGSKKAYGARLAKETGQWVGAPNNWGWLIPENELGIAWYLIAPSIHHLDYHTDEGAVMADGVSSTEVGDWVHFSPN
ncbi:hypothetical protein ASD69_11435 [Lysobacter sp. Root604]|nr:hypothetical protein ASD69_11435 [Lysobacter sp. Root604]